MSMCGVIKEAEIELLLQLLQRERGELPVEIHHSEFSDTKIQLKERLRIVDKLIEALQSSKHEKDCSTKPAFSHM